MLNKLKQLLICNCQGYCLTLCTDQPLPCSIIRVRGKKKILVTLWFQCPAEIYIGFTLLTPFGPNEELNILLHLMDLSLLLFFNYMKIRDVPVFFCLSWFCKRVQWHAYVLSIAKMSRTDLIRSLGMHEVQCSLSEGKTFLQQSLLSKWFTSIFLNWAIKNGLIKRH